MERWTLQMSLFFPVFLCYFSVICRPVVSHAISRRQANEQFPSFRAIDHQDPSIYDVLRDHSARQLQTDAIPGKNYPALTRVVKTNFTCQDVRGQGLYSDMETGCQQYHRCFTKVRKTSFICPPGTLFNQATLTCAYWYNVNCSMAIALRDFANSHVFNGPDNQPLFGNVTRRSTLQTTTTTATTTTESTQSEIVQEPVTQRQTTDTKRTTTSKSRKPSARNTTTTTTAETTESETVEKMTESSTPPTTTRKATTTITASTTTSTEAETEEPATEPPTSITTSKATRPKTSRSSTTIKLSKFTKKTTGLASRAATVTTTTETTTTMQAAKLETTDAQPIPVQEIKSRDTTTAITTSTIATTTVKGTDKTSPAATSIRTTKTPAVTSTRATGRPVSAATQTTRRRQLTWWSPPVVLVGLVTDKRTKPATSATTASLTSLPTTTTTPATTTTITKEATTTTEIVPEATTQTLSTRSKESTSTTIFLEILLLDKPMAMKTERVSPNYGILSQPVESVAQPVTAAPVKTTITSPSTTQMQTTERSTSTIKSTLATTSTKPLEPQTVATLMPAISSHQAPFVISLRKLEDDDLDAPYTDGRRTGRFLNPPDFQEVTTGQTSPKPVVDCDRLLWFYGQHCYCRKNWGWSSASGQELVVQCN